MSCPYGNPECPNPDKPVGEGFHVPCLTRRPRWAVRIGGYPNGWESPAVIETDDPEAAIASYERVRERLRGGGYRYLTVAIFDDNGEGEPLDPERMRELMREAIWKHGWHRAADEAPDDEVVELWKRVQERTA